MKKGIPSVPPKQRQLQLQPNSYPSRLVHQNVPSSSVTINPPQPGQPAHDVSLNPSGVLRSSKGQQPRPRSDGSAVNDERLRQEHRSNVNPAQKVPLSQAINKKPAATVENRPPWRGPNDDEPQSDAFSEPSDPNLYDPPVRLEDRKQEQRRRRPAPQTYNPPVVQDEVSSSDESLSSVLSSSSASSSAPSRRPRATPPSNPPQVSTSSSAVPPSQAPSMSTVQKPPRVSAGPQVPAPARSSHRGRSSLRADRSTDIQIERIPAHEDLLPSRPVAFIKENERGASKQDLLDLLEEERKANFALSAKYNQSQSLLQQLVDESSREKQVDNRRLLLLKAQNIQLERQILLYQQAYQYRHNSLLDVDNALTQMETAVETAMQMMQQQQKQAAASDSGLAQSVDASLPLDALNLREMMSVIHSLQKRIQVTAERLQTAANNTMMIFTPFSKGTKEVNVNQWVSNQNHQKSDYYSLLIDAEENSAKIDDRSRQKINEIAQRLNNLFSHLQAVHTHISNVLPLVLPFNFNQFPVNNTVQRGQGTESELVSVFASTLQAINHLNVNLREVAAEIAGFSVDQNVERKELSSSKLTNCADLNNLVSDINKTIQRIAKESKESSKYSSDSYSGNVVNPHNMTVLLKNIVKQVEKHKKIEKIKESMYYSEVALYKNIQSLQISSLDQLLQEVSRNVDTFNAEKNQMYEEIQNEFDKIIKNWERNTAHTSLIKLLSLLKLLMPNIKKLLFFVDPSQRNQGDHEEEEEVDDRQHGRRTNADPQLIQYFRQQIRTATDAFQQRLVEMSQQLSELKKGE